MTNPDDPPFVPSNPWVTEFTDYVGKIIRISVSFNSSTRNLTGATVFRDADCQYKKIYVGIGPDGTPDTAPDVFVVPSGTTSVTANQLRRNGLNTIDQFVELQITAGP